VSRFPRARQPRSEVQLTTAKQDIAIAWFRQHMRISAARMFQYTVSYPEWQVGNAVSVPSMPANGRLGYTLAVTLTLP